MDKLDEGVKKYVVDKDRKKECQAILKEHSAELNDYLKNYKKRIKYLKAQNLDRSTTDEWYNDFFKMAMEEKNALQKNTVDLRLKLQDMINDDEWTQIVDMSEESSRKLEAKEQKKEMKKSGESFYQKMSDSINEKISDKEKSSNIIAGLGELHTEWLSLVDRLDEIDAVNSDILIDKYATRDQMINSIIDLDANYLELYAAYTIFFRILKENTNDEEYASIVKEINKFKQDS
jgi:hypothetical protein